MGNGAGLRSVMAPDRPVSALRTWQTASLCDCIRQDIILKPDVFAANCQVPQRLGCPEHHVRLILVFVMVCKSIVTIFLLQSGNILFVDPFLRVAAGTANIAVDKHSGEIAPSGLNVIADTVCSGLARNFDDVCAVALGANLSVFHLTNLRINLKRRHSQFLQ